VNNDPMDTWILPKQLHTLACALDTAALNLDSNEQSQICAQSLFVRSKPSPSQIWLRKWTRDSWTRHLSGRILRPSLGERFVTAWTSSLGDILASPSAQPASAKESKTRGISGRGLQMAFDFSDPGSASLRTSKDISAWGCPTSSKTWQEWVIERRGAYSARLKSAHRTSESGCSSWPTAATRDYKGESGSGRQERKGHPADTLPNAMAQWPSPVASEVRQGFQDRSRGMKGSQESLTTVVVKSWPTPNCMDVITPTRDLTQMESKGHWGKSMNTGKLSEMVNYGQAVPASSSTDGSRRESWQTATVSTGAHRQKDGSMIDKLDQQVKQWPTPEASQGGRQGGSFSQNSWKKEDGTPKQPSLAQATIMDQQAQNWATPRANKTEGYSSPEFRPTLHQQAQSWATPRAEMDSGAHRGKPDTLHSQIKAWPTPASSGVTGGPTGLAGGAGNREKLASMLPEAEAKAMGCGKLNPRWVETLMGLPVGWTMPSCVSPVTIERMS
jgi:hypothetical protein